MKQIALQKAHVRLSRAELALERVRAAQTYGDFEHAWAELLVNLNSIFTIVELGARPNPKAGGWFDGVMRKRKTDPLLQYVRQARHADEHGLEPITALSPPSYRLSGTSGNSVITGFSFRGGKLSVTGHKDTGGGEPVVTITGPAAQLVRVTNWGQTYDPPTEHLGERLVDTTPVAIGAAAVAYVTAMLDEAATYAG